MRLHHGVYIAVATVLVGAVEVGAGTNIWPFASIRGDVAAIRIGMGCSIQDHVMIHTRSGEDLAIGDEVVIGHQACVHCREVGSGALIGIGATVLDGAVLGAGCIVAAGAVVRPGDTVAPGTLVAGVPARHVRPVTAADTAYISHIVETYRKLAERHGNGEFEGPAPSAAPGTGAR
jgi:carbonic anhydrase/acetyltransferase-like protein (isoleucine patch superfamily)